MVKCTPFPAVKNFFCTMENLKCQICPAFYTLTIAVMLSHLIRVHGSDPNFSVKCDVHGCQRTFRKPRSYQSHLRYQMTSSLVKSTFGLC